MDIKPPGDVIHCNTDPQRMRVYTSSAWMRTRQVAKCVPSHLRGGQTILPPMVPVITQVACTPSLYPCPIIHEYTLLTRGTHHKSNDVTKSMTSQSHDLNILFGMLWKNAIAGSNQAITGSLGYPSRYWMYCKEI